MAALEQEMQAMHMAQVQQPWPGTDAAACFCISDQNRRLVLPLALQIFDS